MCECRGVQEYMKAASGAGSTACSRRNLSRPSPGSSAISSVRQAMAALVTIPNELHLGVPGRS